METLDDEEDHFFYELNCADIQNVSALLIIIIIYMR